MSVCLSILQCSRQTIDLSLVYCSGAKEVQFQVWVLNSYRTIYERGPALVIMKVIWEDTEGLGFGQDNYIDRHCRWPVFSPVCRGKSVFQIWIADINWINCVSIAEHPVAKSRRFWPGTRCALQACSRAYSPRPSACSNWKLCFNGLCTVWTSTKERTPGHLNMICILDIASAEVEGEKQWSRCKTCSGGSGALGTGTTVVTGWGGLGKSWYF